MATCSACRKSFFLKRLNRRLAVPEYRSMTGFWPWLPVRLLVRTQFNSLAKIPGYHGPLLQSHGNADSIVPYHLGRRLFEAANQPKRFVVIPGRDHNDPQTREYYEELIGFLDGLD